MGELTLDQKKALARARARLKIQAGNKTGVVDQLGSGVNEGIASALGAPVDLMTGAMNAVLPEQYEIKEPFGGSGTFQGAFDPLISDVPPQTTGQGYARRIGQEVGFGVPTSALYAAAPGLGAAARGNMPAYMAANTAGDIGAGAAGETAEKVLPESKIAQIAASILGGIAGSGGVSMMMPGPKGLSLDQVKTQAGDAWGKVHASDAALAPGQPDELVNALRSRLVSDRATNPGLFPRANATVDDIAALPPSSLSEVEDARRLVGRNVAANADESRVGVAMKGEIDNYLNSLTPNQVVGSNPEQAVADLFTARGLTHRIKKAEAVLNKEMRGETRAATTGTGGNEVNATRQNIRTIFDRERDPTLSGKRQGYTPDEMAQMERVVMGTPGQNLARLTSRFAPTSSMMGATFGMGGASGLTGALATGNPLLALAAAPSVIGMIGKNTSEAATKREIAKLLEVILNGAPLKPPPAQSAARAAIAQQLLSGSAQ